MGYQHPEALKLVHTDDEQMTMFMGLLGKVFINESIHSKEMAIATLRHELEHMDQHVKIYKTKGKNGVLEGILNVTKKQKPETKISDFEEIFNEKFYETMSKDISVDDIEAEKYYNALCEYTPVGLSLQTQYKYFNNLLEKEAYAVEKKVLEVYGNNSVLSIDRFPANYKTMVALLQNKGIPIEKQEDLLVDLMEIARVRAIETPENTKKYINICMSAINGRDIPEVDKKFFVKIYDKISDREVVGKMGQKPYQQVETWVREGNLSFEDLLKGI